MIGLGGLVALIGGFGTWYFGNQIDNEKEAKAAQTGKLTASRTKTEVLFSNETSKYPILEIGNSGSMLVQAGEPGTPILIIGGNELLITKVNQQVKVSVKLFDQKGNLLAELIDNEWGINKNHIYDRNYSVDALEVRDSRGKVILQVKVLADRIQLQGIFWAANGFGFAIWVENGMALMRHLKPNGHYNHVIQPMFKYPSDMHLGEQVKN